MVHGSCRVIGTKLCSFRADMTDTIYKYYNNGYCAVFLAQFGNCFELFDIAR